MSSTFLRCYCAAPFRVRGTNTRAGCPCRCFREIKVVVGVRRSLWLCTKARASRPEPCAPLLDTTEPSNRLGSAATLCATETARSSLHGGRMRGDKPSEIQQGCRHTVQGGQAETKGEDRRTMAPIPHTTPPQTSLMSAARQKKERKKETCTHSMFRHQPHTHVHGDRRQTHQDTRKEDEE